MKAGLVLTICGSFLSLIIIFALLSLAGSSFDRSGVAMRRAAGMPSQSGQPRTVRVAEAVSPDNNGSGSWQQSASQAAHDAEVAAEKAYNEVAREIQDVSLEGKVLAVLHENKATRGSAVHVTASDGVVTLTGQVPSERAARSVQEIAAGVYGVKAVLNNLNYPHDNVETATPPDADSTGVAHPAYSDTAPAEKVPAR
jgi:osmotically-inducible protein OsmY